jgi:hypothetical protein
MECHCFLDLCCLFTLEDLRDLVQVTASLFQGCVDCMLGGIQVTQGSNVGGAIIVEVRRRERREVRLRQVELGFRYGKLCFVIVEECVQLCLLASRCIFNGLLNTRAEAPQFDVDIDSYIEIESPIVTWQHDRKNAKLEEDVDYILSRRMRIGLRI